MRRASRSGDGLRSGLGSGGVRSVCAERECGESADGVERLGRRSVRMVRYTVPAGRFVQWKAVLRSGGTVDSVALNYLQKNVAPVVDEVVVQPGARVTAPPAAATCSDGAGGLSTGCGGAAGGELFAGCECGSADGAEGQDWGDGSVDGA